VNLNKFGVDVQGTLEIVRRNRLESRTYLDAASAKELLDKFELPSPKGVLLSGGQVELSRLNSLHSPWALKLISDDVQHKSDAGFVKLGLTDGRDIEQEILRMTETANTRGYSIDGFLVEEMAELGIELVIGGFRDQVFGTTMMFGIGGLFVEIFNDVSFRICPIIPVDAEDMIDELLGKALFNGTRGRPGADRETLINLLTTVGGEGGLLMTLMEHSGEIDEIDLNPVIIRDGNFTVVDVLIALSNPGEAPQMS